MKGQTLINAFVGLAIATVVGAAVAIPVFQSSVGLNTNSVTNETHNSSGSLNDVFTLDNADGGVLNDSQTIYLRNETGGETTKLDSATNYNINYETAEINVSSLPTSFETSLDSNDQYLVTYEGKPQNYIESATTRTVLNFVPLAIALAIFLASFAPIRG